MKQSNKRTAAIYCRVANSFDDAYTIRNQERTAYAYAKENGYAVVSIYSDNGYSGLSMERPALQNLIQAMESGEVTHVIVRDISRLFRDFRLLMQFEQFCEKNSVTLVPIGEQHNRKYCQFPERRVLGSE